MKRFLVGLFLILSIPIFAMDGVEEYELAAFTLKQKPNEPDDILDYISLSIALIMHQSKMPKNQKQNYSNKASVKKPIKKNTDQEFSFFEIIGSYNSILLNLMKRYKN